ncbi:MAG: S8 family serine peptidase [Thermoguttaceae bacterium]
MFWGYRRSGNGRIDCGNRSGSLGFEQLEPRQLLSAQPAGPGPDWLRFDGACDESSILVRFRPEYRAAFAAGGASILAGTQIGRQLGQVAGLHKVSLADGVGVDAALAAYRKSPWVAYAEPNFRVSIADVYPNDPRFGEMWPLENLGQTGGQSDADIDAPRAWEVTRGSGSAIVAVIDTGVDYTHPDLDGNMWVNAGETAGDGIDNDGNGYVDDVYGYDFINRDGDPMDDQGHGTHVAGTIGAEGDNAIGVAGINWDVQIMALKFIGPDGWGDGADAIEAIYYALANGATITNASWGGDPYSQALYDAIAAARDAEHIFVAAAGNGNMLGVGQDNDATLYYPASYDLDNIVAVAAVDDTDALASFSNYGATQVDLAAPGVDVLSTIRGGGYGLNSGTSMAAPHATGVLALVQDLHPDWTYDEVIGQVLGSVDPLPELYGVTVTGGRLNAAAAVGNPEPPAPPPPAGSLPIQETFADGIADFLRPQTGDWEVGGGRYTAAPIAENHDLVAVSTLDIAGPLPANLEIQVTINADEGRSEFFGIVLSDHLTNGYVVFDYHSPDDFKFAGADMRGDAWQIGRRDAAGWHVDAMLGETLDAATNYAPRVVIENGTRASLFNGDSYKLGYDYPSALNDGLIGLGMRDSTTHFDNLGVEEYIPDTVGPQLVSLGPFDRYSGDVGLVRLTFSEQVDTATFTVDDIVEFSGPAGAVPVTSVTETPGSNGRQFDLAFTPQSALGEYTLVIGPEICDRLGNPMDGDGDGLSGEPIEDRATAAFSIVPVAEHIDFGTTTSPLAAGYARVTGADVYSAAVGYGWQAAVSSFDRETGSDLLRDLNYGPRGTFLVDVPNGQYELTLAMGDQGALHDLMGVFLEGAQVDTISTAAGQFSTTTYLVDVNDGQLTLGFVDQGGSNANFVINALDLVTIGPDRVPPTLVGVDPSGPVGESFERIVVAFDEPIDAASFAAEDVSLVGPAGAAQPLAVAPLDARSFEVRFAPQTEPGDYQLTIGPDVSDLAGNPLAAAFSTHLVVEAAIPYVARIDFGTTTSPVAAGYARLAGSDLYSAAVGYGWQTAVSSWNRESGSDLLRDFNYGPRGTFLVDVPNGQYELTLAMGDQGALHDLMGVFLEGAQVDTISTAAGQFSTTTYLVDVNDGQLTLGFVDQGGSNANFVINALDLVTIGPDRVPPTLVGVDPSGPVGASFERIVVAFDEPIDAASFTAEDVSLVGPAGAVQPLAVAPLDARSFEVRFAPQTEPGDYQLTIGPDVSDLAGNGLAVAFSTHLVVEAAIPYVARIDFGTTTSPVAAGYARLAGSDLYSAAVGYGWQTAVSSFDRETGSDLLRDLNYGPRGTFLVDVPNGQYELTLAMGDQGALHDLMGVFLEGAQVDTISTAAGQFSTTTYLVDVNDGQLTLGFVDQGGSNANFVVNALDLVTIGPDRVPPTLVGVDPSGPVGESFERIVVAFDEPIDAASFAAEDVSLVGPAGAAQPLAVAPLDARSFEVRFAPQTEPGDYQLTIGPDVSDLAGNGLAVAFSTRLVVEAAIPYVARIDFGTTTSPLAAGYARLAGSDLYSAAVGYGWQTAVSSFNRESGSDLLRDLNYGPRGTFLVDVPNGQYELTLAMGDQGALHDLMGVFLEGAQVDTISTAAGQFSTTTYLVDVNDGQLTLGFVDQGGSNANFVINALDLVTIGPDRVPPTLVGVDPSGPVGASFERIVVAFDEPIDAASFTAEDVSLVGPAGAAQPLAVAPLDARSFEVRFAPQTEPGDYQLTIGPDVSDLAGNPMAGAFAAELVVEAAPLVAAKLDFGTSISPVAAGYTQVTQTTVYSAAAGYGWQQAVYGFNRTTGGDLLRDFNYAPQGRFFYDVPNGSYDVTVTLGDEGGLHDQVGVFLEGLQVATVTTAAGVHETRTFQVEVADGQLTLLLVDLGGSNANFAINALEIMQRSTSAASLSLAAVAGLEEEVPAACASDEVNTLSRQHAAAIAALWQGSGQPLSAGPGAPAAGHAEAAGRLGKPSDLFFAGLGGDDSEGALEDRARLAMLLLEDLIL